MKKPEKPPLRRPLILTFAELNDLTYYIGEKVRELRRLRPSTLYGKALLKRCRSIQKKLWKV